MDRKKMGYWQMQRGTSNDRAFGGDGVWPLMSRPELYRRTSSVLQQNGSQDDWRMER